MILNEYKIIFHLIFIKAGSTEKNFFSQLTESWYSQYCANGRKMHSHHSVMFTHVFVN